MGGSVLFHGSHAIADVEAQLVERVDFEGVPHGQHVKGVDGVDIASGHFRAAHQGVVLGHFVPTGGTGIFSDDTENVDRRVRGDLAEDHGIVAVEVHGVVLLVHRVQPDVGLLGEFIPHRGFEVNAVGILLVEDVDQDAAGLDGAGEVRLLVVLGRRGSVGVALQAVVRHVNGVLGRVVDLECLVVGPSLDVLGDEELVALGGEHLGGQGDGRQEEEFAHGFGCESPRK